ENASWSTAPSTDNEVMKNVIISYTYKVGDSGEQVWKATDGKTYYWPNYSKTTLSFFAYSPYSVAGSTDPSVAAEGMGVTPTFTAAGGIKIEGYEHKDQTLDFMTADAKDRTYTQPDGPEGESEATDGTVKLQFKHQLTQLVFAVKKAADYNGITMELVSIKLDKIGNTATFENGKWGTPSTYSGTYNIDYTGVTPMIFTNADAVTSNGMTVIPQDLIASAESAPGQTMTIVYEISGTGVAKEIVTKTVDLYTQNLTKWEPNQKITYNISIGMQEILFNPSVSTWTTPESSAEVPIN
ncbi:MAG: fimbrillin family protein, partial [Firmicutes bacterium]|nr:fimbrillin family protein [Bacillota bacterium]